MKKKLVYKGKKTLYQVWLNSLDVIDWYNYVEGQIIPEGTDRLYLEEIIKDHEKIMEPIINKWFEEAGV